MIRHGRNLPPPGGRGSQFIRLSKTGDPNAAICYGRGNGGPTLDQRAVVDGGFERWSGWASSRSPIPTSGPR
jgi:hypothetical protein